MLESTPFDAWKCARLNPNGKSMLGLFPGTLLADSEVEKQAKKDAKLGLHEGQIEDKSDKKRSSWGYHPLKKVNPKLPNVLLVGDSIMASYCTTVTRELEGKDQYKSLMKAFINHS